MPTKTTSKSRRTAGSPPARGYAAFSKTQKALAKKHGTPAEFAAAVYQAVPGDISMDEAADDRTEKAQPSRASVICSVSRANGLPENGWLMAEEYEWFHAGYNYAATQSCAIPALAIISAEQAHSIVTMIIRGARMHGHKIPDVLP